MHRYDPIIELMVHLRNAYAPAIQAIWQQVTASYIREYYQLRADFTPKRLGLPGRWELWAER